MIKHFKNVGQHIFLRKRLLFLILVIQFFVTIFYANGIGSLKYSFIGDEYAMYDYAKGIATGAAQVNIFSLNGVYGTNPTLGSYYQAGAMKIFGINIYGWKLSSIIVIFPLGLLMFYLIKKISNVKAAFLALFMLDSSFYLYNFFQIGYLNNLSLLLLVSIMFMLAYLETNNKRENYIHFTVLGILTGFSWYFYIGKLFVFIITGYLLTLHKFRVKFYKYFLCFLIPALFLIFLSLINSQGADLGTSKTILRREFSDNFQIVKNILSPLYLQFYTPSQTHYLPTSSYVDPITAVLSVIGVVLLLASIFYRRLNIYPHYHRFFLLFLFLSFAIGITSPYPYPPTTRGIHYVPFYIIFAIYGLLLITHALKRYKIIHHSTYLIVGCAILFINLQQIAKPLPYNTTEQILNFIKQTKDKNFLFLNNCGFNFYNLTTLSEGYKLNKKIEIQDVLSQNACQTQKYIFSCLPISCTNNEIATFENRIFLFKVTGSY